MFDTEYEVHNYANKYYPLNNDDIAVYDIDKLNDWVKSNSDSVECSFVLDMLNIFSDMPYEYINNDEYIDVYDKLFFGTNILAKEDDELYIPTWNDKEIEQIKFVMKKGIELFEKFS